MKIGISKEKNLKNYFPSKSQRSKSLWDGTSETHFNFVPNLKPKITNMVPSPFNLQINLKKNSLNYENRLAKNSIFLLNDFEVIEEESEKIKKPFEESSNQIKDKEEINPSDNSILTKSSKDSLSSYSSDNNFSQKISSENVLKLHKENYKNEIDIKDFTIKGEINNERHSFYNDKLYVLGKMNNIKSLVQQKNSILNSRDIDRKNNSFCFNEFDLDYQCSDLKKTEISLKKKKLENSIFSHIFEKKLGEDK